MRAARRVSSVVVGSLLLFHASNRAAAAANVETGSAVATVAEGRATVFIELTEHSTAHEYAHVLDVERHGHNMPTRRVLDLADAAARNQMRVVVNQQERFARNLRARALGAVEIYRVQRALNGFAVQVDGSAIAALRALPDVAAVRVMTPKFPSSGPASNAVPFLQVPTVWQLPAGVGHADGTGVRIGIIDTGIDYIHADFGGSGALADYQANNTTTAPTAFFPSAKVVGGYDFAGDAYNASNVPAPDPNPMDCNGHGSHVAGIAAGFGVTSAGTTFTGPYDGTVPFSSLRIHPGIAPNASLYALRVFGCGGSTNLVLQAIDWAMDPNNDGNLSDHLDVINMSLGSNFGNVDDDPDVLASDAAAAAGVSVVISAGNSGNAYFISSAPGASDRATTVAASDDDGSTAGGYRINSPAAIAGFRANTVPVAYGGIPPAVGLSGSVVLAHDGVNNDTDGCEPLNNAAQIAGNIAIFDRNIAVCGNDVQAKNAQNAGAVAAIQIFDTDTLGGVAGTDVTVTIPYIRITHTDGATIKANLASGVNVTLFRSGDEVASFTSRGPRGGRIGRLKPDISAPGVNITSVQTGNTCTGTATTGCQTSNASGFLPGSQTLVLSGTSMAAPQVAGLTALLRQIHPDWSAEEIKAALMNASSHAVTEFPGGNGLTVPVQRAGSGRPDVPWAAQNPAVAFSADAVGTVSASLVDEDFTAPAVRTKHVLVENKSGTAVSYDVAIVTGTDAPGIAFSLPGGSSVSVPPAGAATIEVRFDANPAQMQHTREATMPATEVVTGTMSFLGTLNKQFITEEAAYLVFSIAGIEKMRVPLYATARPASQMTASAPANGAGATGSGTIALSGTGVCTGTPAPGTCAASPADEVSLVSPFELQIVSALDPSVAPRWADIQYAGVAYSAVNNILMFGVSTYGDWGSPSETVFNVYIDTNNDGVFDYILFNGSAGRLGQYLFGNSTSFSDAHINVVLRLADNNVSWSLSGKPTYAGTYTNGDPALGDNALMRNNTAILSVSPIFLGMGSTPTPFHYMVVTCPNYSMLCKRFGGFQFDQEPPGATSGVFWDANNQGLDFGGAKLVQDLDGATLPVTWNTTNLANDGALGALLLHHHNTRGFRAQAIPLNGATTADIAVTVTVSPANASLGQNIVLTVSATNNGPADATNVAVWAPVPTGTTYEIDDSGSTFIINSGLWTIGSLASGATATLHLTVNLSSPAPYQIRAQLARSSPLDANIANNTVTFNYPASADVALAATPGSASVPAGAPATFTFTLTNNGPDASTNLSVVNTFPDFPTISYVSATPSTGTFDAVTRTWTVPALGNGSSATLQVTVNVPGSLGPLVSSAVVASGTNDPSSLNNSASATITVTGALPAAPLNVVAAAVSDGEIDVTWTPVSGADSYDVYRRDTSDGTYTWKGNTNVQPFQSIDVTQDHAYLYKVQAVNAVGHSADSNVDLAVARKYPDDPLVPRTTRIMGTHLDVMRSTVNGVRALAGLPLATFGFPPGPIPAASGSTVKANDILTLRQALDEARNELHLSLLGYANPATGGTSISASDFQEIREGTK